MESELSSWGAWYVGMSRSRYRSLRTLGMAPVVPGYIDSGSGLEFALWPLERWSREGPEDEAWMRNTTFSSLSLVVS